jgi:pimeloyl-ACP methyl ester carboxylesterase
VHTRYTNEAADRLGEFRKPALIAWSREDRFFKPEHAKRLAQELPNARLEWIENARSFSPEDEPGRLAELIAAFVRGRRVRHRPSLAVKDCLGAAT